MNRYFIGIDGGGTNSRLLACDLQGKIIGKSFGKSTNIESNSSESVKDNLDELVNAFLVSSGSHLEDCLGLCIGTAGVDTKRTWQEMERIAGMLSYPCPVHVTNDAQIALAAQTRGEPGILIISGTGSIGYGVNDLGEGKRVGGYGYLVGDEGSAYWLGRKAITASLLAHDEIGSQTLLLPMILKTLGLTQAEGLVDFVYGSNKLDIAALAPVVIEAGQKGDAIAGGIIEEAAQRLAAMATALVRQLDMGQRAYPLVFAGGLLLNNPNIRQRVYSIAAAIYPKLIFTMLEKEAVVGAVYLAARQQQVPMPDINI
ncbi:MAG: hypothetical protein GX781_03735 [Clostridiales bacterium]|nr:hypothetical protein [Clostridiales bacterium]